jgi:hypothetical protein
MVAYTYYSSFLGGPPRQQVCETPSQPIKLSIVVHVSHLSYMGGINRSTTGWPAQIQDPISKITKRKRSIAQVLEYLPSKFRTLSSNPSTTKKKKKKKKKENKNKPFQELQKA